MKITPEETNTRYLPDCVQSAVVQISSERNCKTNHDSERFSSVIVTHSHLLPFHLFVVLLIHVSTNYLEVVLDSSSHCSTSRVAAHTVHTGECTHRRKSDIVACMFIKRRTAKDKNRATGAHMPTQPAVRVTPNLIQLTYLPGFFFLYLLNLALSTCNLYF